MLLSRIREISGPMHQELESVLNISKDVQSRADYCALLKNFLALYEPWENAISKYEPEFQKMGLDLKARLRCPNLRRDLEALAEQPILAAPATMIPQMENFPAALGSLYVLEGSSLGGQVLTREFTERLGLSPSALHFFNSHGPQVGKMWKDFCAALNAKGEEFSEEERAAAANGARDSFSSLIRWFGAK